MTKEERKEKKELKHWEDEVRLIPKMIQMYCHGVHKTKRGLLCEDCQELKEYALMRLSKCPFKKNKGFCNFCTIRCYKPDMREKIRAVMKYSGPRMIFSHPIFSFGHVFQLIKYKKKMRKEAKKDD